MSRRRSFIQWKAYASAALALWSFTTGGAGAQTPIAITDLDWTLDRGAAALWGPAGQLNGAPTRLGANNIRAAGNNPGPAVPLWTFPFTRDLYNFGSATARPGYSVIDNPNPNDLDVSVAGGEYRYLPYSPLTNPTRPPRPEDTPGYTTAIANAGSLPGFGGLAPALRPRSVFTNGGARSWVILPTDLRSGGYSRSSDPSFAYNYDYDYVNAVHDDFPIPRGNGPDTALTSAEADQFPFASPTIYGAVHRRLIASTATQPFARWRCGQLQGEQPLNGQARDARYAVDIYNPGDGSNLGTLAAPDIRPSTRRVFVRVSWRGTVDNAGNFVEGTGAAGAGGINDPANSRIFLLNEGQTGWTRLQGSAGTAAFPYDGTVNNQIVVTMYTLTPDSLTDPAYGRQPIITADAVRFTALLLPSAPGLGPVGTLGGYISASGRILGPGVSSSTIVPNNPTNTNPLFYFAREEFTLDSTLRLYDPTDANSIRTFDPSTLAVVPVFYCIDNQRGNAFLTANPTTLISSRDKVRWRYVGAPFSGVVAGTASASPLLANVRCRDGVVRSMVYFATTTTDGRLGRIYAFDPAGDFAQGTTQCYWAYPSVRPLLGNEYQNVGIPAANQGRIPEVFEDPNYNLFGYARPAYPNAAAGWGADLPAAGTVRYFDGDIRRNAATNLPEVRTDTEISMGGIQGSPLVADDPSNPTGTQLLIVPSLNGRIYAFDAGGRGDFGTTVAAGVLGTTQRIWTWPHFSADAFRHLSPSVQLNANTLANEESKGAFPSSPAMDTANTTTGPILIGGGGTTEKGNSEGHFYSLKLDRDAFQGLQNGQTFVFAERRVWQYPAAGKTLGVPPSTGAVYNFGGNRTTPLIYFTAGGRTYTVDGASLTPVANSVPTAALTWVYPYTPNPPAQVAGDDTTASLDPGFIGNAPLVQRVTWSDGTQKDLCTVLSSNGTMISLDPAGNGNGTTAVIASNTSANRSTTRTSPTATLLISQPNLDRTVGPLNGSRYAFLFGDDNGTVQAYGTVPDPANPTVHPLLWRYENTVGHSGSAILSNAIAGIGDDFGIYHAYGFGEGVDGRLPTLGIAPPLPRGNENAADQIAIDDGQVDLDMRLLDIFDDAAYQTFFQSSPAGALSPGVNTAGNPFNTSPSAADVPGPTRPLVREWGDHLNVVAWGVYHAITQDTNQAIHGVGPPQIFVKFTITGPQFSSTNQNLRGQPVTTTVPVTFADGTVGNWPTDYGMTNAQIDTLKFYANALPNANGQQFTGRAQNVYPWVATVRLSNDFLVKAGWTPGTAYKISARAEIRQQVAGGDPNNPTAAVLLGTNFDNALQFALGQHDDLGKTNSRFQAGINDKAFQATERSLIIGNPLALSVRGGLVPQGTFPSESLIGWIGDIRNANNALKPEVLANGNRLGGSITLANGVTTSSEKSLFAPGGMIQDGASKGYTVLDTTTGEQRPGFFIADRSNLSRATGAPVTVKATVHSLQWKGGPSSVMNPLPFDAMPSDAQATEDYPNLPGTALQLLKSGQGLVDNSSGVALTAPVYPNNNPVNRQIQGTQIDLQVSVPRFQPANVNFGVSNDQNKGQYGSAYQGLGGVIRGNGSLPMIGPLTVQDGFPTPFANALTYPAGGYITGITITATNPIPVTGSGIGVAYNPSNIYLQPTAPGANVPGPALRQLELGVTVPPTVRMKIDETTIDLGKLAHSSGYTDLVGNGANTVFRNPFAPFDLANGYNPTNANALVKTYWSDYFRPFTLKSESNVNLARLRVGKLFGTSNAKINGGSLTNYPAANVASSLQFKSDGVNNLSGSPIFGMGFAVNGVGNIGLVSSFDHPSRNSANYRESNVWANIANPFITGAGIANVGLPTADNINTGDLGWATGLQRQPTLHKPRPGDGQGTVATVPDIPYAANLLLQFPNGNGDGSLFTADKPKLSLAIPLGTAAGEYSADILAYEDTTPFQWRNWVSRAGNTPLGADADGILNSQTNNPDRFRDFALEPYTNPGTKVKVRVVETRLTNNSGKGALGQIDALGPISQNFANLMPAAVTFLTPPNNGTAQNGISMFWATNRGSGNNLTALSPWNLASSFLSTSITEVTAPGNVPVQIGDANFSVPGTGNNIDARWWTSPNLFTGLDAGGNPISYPLLFPSNAADAAVLNTPYLPGNIVPSTGRVTSPAAARLEDPASPYSNQGVLFWQGQVVKTQGNQQVTDSRTFYQLLAVNNRNQLAPFGATLSFVNDPALTKQNPKPLFVQLPGQKLTFLFWQAGNRSNSQLYYNVNATDGVAPDGWSRDTVLPTPAALTFVSEPSPTLRVVTAGQKYAIEVAYSGQLKNRRNVEVLMSKFEIVSQLVNGQRVYSLKPMTFSKAFQEPTYRDGATATYIAKDAAWTYGLDANGNGTVRIELDNGPGTNPVLLNATPAGPPAKGKFDEATGLLYFDDAVRGGQILVDTRSGSVTFPNIPPGRQQRVLVSYTPQVMRLNVFREDSNIERENPNYAGLGGNDVRFVQNAAGGLVGNNTGPTLILDRSPNRRNRLVNPQVVFSENGTPVSPTATDGAIPHVARRWVLYRKSDALQGGLYYKTQRLMIQLPRDIGWTTNANGQVLYSLNFNTAIPGGYEVDLDRSRVYFDEPMEGAFVGVNYLSKAGVQFSNMKFRVQWDDEIANTAKILTLPSGEKINFYSANVETQMPIDTNLSEGQVTAYKDPYLDKLWVFWASTRNGVSDLYYQTLTPQFSLFPTYRN